MGMEQIILQLVIKWPEVVERKKIVVKHIIIFKKNQN